MLFVVIVSLVLRVTVVRTPSRSTRKVAPIGRMIPAFWPLYMVSTYPVSGSAIHASLPLQSRISSMYGAPFKSIMLPSSRRETAGWSRCPSQMWAFERTILNKSELCCTLSVDKFIRVGYYCVVKFTEVHL